MYIYYISLMSKLNFPSEFWIISRLAGLPGGYNPTTPWINPTSG